MVKLLLLAVILVLSIPPLACSLPDPIYELTEQGSCPLSHPDSDSFLRRRLSEDEVTQAQYLRLAKMFAGMRLTGTNRSSLIGF